MNFTDSVEISGTRVRDDGYLVVDACVARTGIQRYLGSEVGRPDLTFVDVLRPEEEVFKTDAMASFAHRPVTDDHPSERVTKDNWSKFSVGQTDGDIKRDGQFLRIPLMVADSKAIDKVSNGKRELSAGYTCDLVWEGGETPDGQTYDAVQTNIRANHVAIVQAGRAGKDCRIGDNATKWGTAPTTTADRKEAAMPDNLRNVMVDGLSVPVNDQGAQAITKLIGDRDALKQQLADKDKKLEEEIAEKDKELAKKDAALDDAKSKILDQNAIDKLVADRTALEATAAQIAKDVKPAGLSDADLKLACVKQALGDSISEEKLKDQAYVDARFDILAEDGSKKDDFRDAMKGRTTTTTSGDLSDAHAARQKAFNDMLHHDQTGKEAS